MHIDGYVSIATLGGIIWVIAEFRLMKWQHKKMWADYERRHEPRHHRHMEAEGD